MKKLEAIIQPHKLEQVKDALNNIGIKGMTVVGYADRLSVWQRFAEACAGTLLRSVAKRHERRREKSAENRQGAARGA